MINLERLQDKIDNLFDTETSDSLTNWIFTKRFPEINQIVGEGEFVSLQTSYQIESIEFIQESDAKVSESKGVNPSLRNLLFYKLAS